MLRITTTIGRARLVAAVIAMAVLVAAVTVGNAKAGFPREERPVVRTAGHSAWGLCGTEDIYPVARFDREYTDPVGNHYHLWLPPAGPPFAELCLKSPLSDDSPLP